MEKPKRKNLNHLHGPSSPNFQEPWRIAWSIKPEDPQKVCLFSRGAPATRWNSCSVVYICSSGRSPER